MIDYEAIGKKIKKARLNRDISQTNFANKLGVSVGFISQVESGQKCFNVARLEEVSSILEKPISYFVEGIDIDEDRATIQEIEFLLRNISKDRILLIEKLMETIKEEI